MIVAKRYYSLHDFLSFSIAADLGPVARLLDSTKPQFENFSTDDDAARNDPVDLEIEIGPFEQQERSCRIVDSRHFIDEDYFDSRKFSTWRIELERLSGAPIARIDTNLAGLLTRPLNLTELLIQYCLMQRDCPAVHAAAIARGDRVLLLPGSSGAGKTTLCAALLAHGYDFLGDNYVLLHRGTAYSYLSPLNIFFYNRLPIINAALTAQDRFGLFSKKLLYDVTRGYIKILQKVNPVDVFGRKSMRQHGEISHICFMEPNESHNDGLPGPVEISKKDLAQKLVLNMTIEWHVFSTYFTSYGYLFPNSLLGSFWTECEKSILRNLSGVKNIYSLGVPTRYTAASREEATRILMDLHST